MIYIIIFILFVIVLFAFYKLGKQSLLIEKEIKVNNNTINDIKDVINKLKKGKF